MTFTTTHLKLTIKDIYDCEASDDKLTFFTSLLSSDSKTIFQNLRCSGLIMQKNEESFILDDGTGLILVKTNSNSFIEIPNVAEYVEVFGKLEIDQNNKRNINAISCIPKKDPLEEIRYLLEQAAIHRDFLRFKEKSPQLFLSSEANVPMPDDNFILKISNLFTNCDRSVGLTYHQIVEECGGDEKIAGNVINWLAEREYSIYKDGDYYKPL